MVVYCRAVAVGDLPTLRGSRVNAVWFNAARAVHAKRRDGSSLLWPFTAGVRLCSSSLNGFFSLYLRCQVPPQNFESKIPEK